MFQAFGRAIAGDRLDPATTRAKAIEWMMNHKDDLIHFHSADIGTTNQSIDQYIQDMANSGTWGDALSLHALCSVYFVQARILKKTGPSKYTWLSAGDATNFHTIYLYLDSDHYENLIGTADAHGL